MTLLTVFAIGAGITTGYYIFVRFGSGGADAAYDAIALGSSIFWILAGIFAILGGFVLVGFVILIVFSYIAFAKGTATRDRVRSRIAG